MKPKKPAMLPSISSTYTGCVSIYCGKTDNASRVRFINAASYPQLACARNARPDNAGAWDGLARRTTIFTGARSRRRDTTGIEPDFALVKFKKLAGGGYSKIRTYSLDHLYGTVWSVRYIILTFVKSQA